MDEALKEVRNRETGFTGFGEAVEVVEAARKN